MASDRNRTAVPTARTDGNPRRRWRPVAAGDLLGRVLDGATRRAGFVDARLISDWPTIAGSELGTETLPLRVERRSRTLVLLVRPTAALLVQHQEPQLLERINVFFGSDLLRRLRLVQGPLPRAAVAAPPVPVDAATVARVAATVAAVADPDLRAALHRLGVTMAGREAPRP